MSTPRERLLILANEFNTRHGRPSVDIVKFNEGVEWAKDYFEKWLKIRRVPMLAEGLVFHSITGHISKERRDTILFELEDENRIICNHSPDGLDTWRVAGENQEGAIFVGNIRGEDLFATKSMAFLINGLQDTIKCLREKIRELT